MTSPVCGNFNGGGLPRGFIPGQFLQWNGLWVPSSWVLPLASPDESDVGDVLTVTATGTANFEPLPLGDSYILHWAANGPVNGTTFLNGGGGNTAPGAITAVPGGLVMVDDGIVDIMEVLHNNPSGAFTPAYTLSVNEVDQTLSVSLPSVSSQGSDLVNSVAVTRGQRVRVKCVSSTTLATLRINVTCRFTRGP